MTRNLTVTWKRTGQTSNVRLDTNDGRLVITFSGTGNTFHTKKQFADTKELKKACDWLEMHLKAGKEFPWGTKGNSKWSIETKEEPCPI